MEDARVAREEKEKAEANLLAMRKKVRYPCIAVLR